LANGSARGLLVTTLLAVAAIAAVEGAQGATTRVDPYGTTLLDGRKVFPIVLAKGPELGATTPTGADALDEVVGAGVTFFKVGPATIPWTPDDVDDAHAWNREAGERGAYTWINMATLSEAPDSARLGALVTELTDGEWAQAIGMWKGADEPLWVGTKPEELQYAYCIATSRGPASWCDGDLPADADHLWVTIQAPRGTAAQLAPYSAVTDIHGVDDYPVTWTNRFDPKLHEVGQWTATLASITPNHAVWTTLQVCASGSDNDPTGEFVLPTREQERYMLYDAIINGARSLAFYGGNINRCWTTQDAALGWNWTFWDSVLGDLIREISAVSPIAPALVSPETTGTPTSSDPTTQVISRRGATSDDLWVIAARSGDGSTPVTIGGLPSTVRTGTVYTEGRSVSVTNGSFTDTFDRWGVHVYHFRNEPPPPPAPPPVPPPVPPSEPTAAPPAAQRTPSRLLSAGLSSVPSKPRAGRLYTVRLRVVTESGSPVRSGSVRCAARVGKKALRPISRRWKNGYATCAWRLPKSARGQRLQITVGVTKDGRALTRRLARRVS
jgi:hypothetical protein